MSSIAVVVTVPSYEIKNGKTVFTIQTTWKDGSQGPLTMQYRYSTLLAKHTDMLNEFKKSNLASNFPEFPPKGGLFDKKTSAPFLNARKAALETYLKQVSELKYMLDHFQIRELLGFTKSMSMKPSANPIQRSEAKAPAAAAAAPEAASPETAAKPYPKKEEKKVDYFAVDDPLAMMRPPEEEKPKKEQKQPTKQVRSNSGSMGKRSTTTSSFQGFGVSSKKTYNLKAKKSKLNEQARDAVKMKDFDGLISLLKAKANPNYADSAGMTLLHLAALFNERKMVDVLIKLKANPYAKNKRGETAVKVAPPSLRNHIKSKVPPPEAE